MQWVDIDMMLASVSYEQFDTYNDCSQVQWVDIDMMLASVSFEHEETSMIVV